MKCFAFIFGILMTFRAGAQYASPNYCFLLVQKDGEYIAEQSPGYGVKKLDLKAVNTPQEVSLTYGETVFSAKVTLRSGKVKGSAGISSSKGDIQNLDYEKTLDLKTRKFYTSDGQDRIYSFDWENLITPAACMFIRESNRYTKYCSVLHCYQLVRLKPNPARIRH